MSSQPTIEPGAQVEPLPTQNKLATQATQQQPTEEEHPTPEPLLVRVIKDDELGTFERKTIRYGVLGIVVASLALSAACVSAYFIYGQFTEMAKQTGILAESLKKQREDSAAAVTTTGTQLAALQSQITIARYAIREAQDSLALTRNNFIQDQRPYVLVSKAELEKDNVGNVTLRSDTPIMWRVEFLNYGKSPAVNDQYMSKVFFGKDARTEAFAYMDKMPKNPDKITPGRSVDSMPPGEHPDRPSYITSISDTVPARDDLVFITSNEFALYLVGRTFYQDMAGHRYYTDYCRFRLLTGAIAGCAKYNAVH